MLFLNLIFKVYILYKSLKILPVYFKISIFL